MTASLASTGGLLGGMSEYPVQISKVQAPPLRDETLARDRLLDWLSVKIHRRAVLLTAEAGYGKTTLLADFTRRTRVRVLWYRLDRGDRDWVGFIAYLVATIRIHVPEFGASTRALLSETATSAPSLDTVLEAFLRELAGLPAEPTALVFDDFHLVDDAADIRHVVRELLTRGPERLSLVFASRREPPIRLARLRALGEVAELGTDDLRFDAEETERLFRETYEMRLEPSLLAELNRRTEGWAASLQLVRAALHDRNPGQVRSFISSLSGAEGHLYEYLAEEVVGELPDDLQQFLMRTSVLETVDLTLGPIAAEVSVDEARRLIEEGERHGLLGKGGPRSRHVVRAHPLVRDFLQARLTREIGVQGIAAVHRRVARVAEPMNWHVATLHYIEGGATDDAARVLADSLDLVLATGAYAAAQELSIALGSTGVPGLVALVLNSRIAQQQGLIAEGLSLANEAWSLNPHSTAALLNLVTARNLAGDIDGALDASHLLEATRSELSEVGRAYQQTLGTSLTGSLREAITDLEALADRARAARQFHFHGVAALHLALIRTAEGDFASALANAEDAIASLSATSAGVELVSARLARASALAFGGDLESARAEVADLEASVLPGQQIELAFESAVFEGLLGDPAKAWPRLRLAAADLDETLDHDEQALYARALLKYRDGDLVQAFSDSSRFQFGVPRSSICFDARRYLLHGTILSAQGDPRAADAIERGTGIAERQGSMFWTSYGRSLVALADPFDPSETVRRIGTSQPVVLSALAERAVARLPELDASARSQLSAEAARRPSRWLGPLRNALASENPTTRLLAAEMVATIGEPEDVRRLRDLGRRLPARAGPRLSYQLARRLAPRATIEDLGRVQIHLGNRVLDGVDVRRKVLALLCLLVSKPGFTATREEVADSLWPEHDPESALNSLNQTVYFLRRVFEPTYSDDTSPGYVGQDGETIWLDSELVDSRSRKCLEIIRSIPAEPTPESALALAENYRSHFALDFAYEDWSTTYRDSLHSAYLRVVEHAIQIDLRTGHFARGIYLAERAAEVDPDSDEIQVALIRLYRHSGAHAAAAEQYSHYARGQRELGLEPVPIEQV